MKVLECRIPPPIVLTLLGIAMWALARETGVIPVDLAVRIALGLGAAFLGGVIAITAVRHFRRASTTVNPMKPQTTSALVTSGIFGYTRNPMYVGMACVLIGWALFLAAPWTLLGPVLFVLYITRFQIIPEERVLAQIFGSEFTSYMSKVRRWL